MNRHRLASFAYCMVAVTAVAMLLAPSSARAQEAPAPQGDTLVVSPPVDEQDASPSQTLERKITLTNNTSAEREFTATVKNAQPVGNEGAADLTPDDGPLALASWVQVSPSTIRVPANKSQEFTVKVTVPAEAGPGTRAGAIVFSPAPQTDSGASVSVVSEISSLLLVNVSGEATEDLKLQSFGAEKTFYQSGPVEFSAIFRNDGNIVAKPQGTVTIKNVFGKTVQTLPVEAQRVLPSAERKFSVKFDQKNLVGPYTAEFQWNAGSVSAEPSTDKIWGLPLSIVIPVVGGLLFVFLVIWLPRRRWKAVAKVLFSKPPAE